MLGEDALTLDQRESVDAILRNALRVQDYVAQLRAMTGPDADVYKRQPAASGGAAHSIPFVSWSICLSA